jgi:hypothetical protein
MQFWRAAGLTYLSYCRVGSSVLRSALKEPMRTKALKSGDNFEIIRRTWSGADMVKEGG